MRVAAIQWPSGETRGWKRFPESFVSWRGCGGACGAGGAAGADAAVEALPEPAGDAEFAELAIAGGAGVATAGDVGVAETPDAAAGAGA